MSGAGCVLLGSGGVGGVHTCGFERREGMSALVLVILQIVLVHSSFVLVHIV
jgi:hypothetical protein